MSLWSDVRTGFGRGVGQLGNFLGVGERGYSERVGNNPSPWALNFPVAKASGGGYENITTPTEWEKNNDPYGYKEAEYQQSYGPSGATTYAPAPNLTPQISDAERAAYQAQYTAAMGDYDSQLRELEAQRLGIMNQAKKFQNDYKKQMGQLGTQKETTLSGQKAFFTNVGPDVYQSQEGAYANKAIKAYQEGVSDLSAQKAQNEALLGQYLNQIGGQQGDIEKARSLAGEQYAAGTGEVAPTQQIAKGITTNFRNYDVSGTYDKLSKLYLVNTLAGMTPEMNKANIRTAIDKEVEDPDIAAYLYEQFQIA